MEVPLGAEDFRRAEERARSGGYFHLAEIYRSLAIPLSRSLPPPPPSQHKPLVYMVVDHKGWCGERLSLELIKYLPEYDCKIVRLGDSEHLELDADLYLYRNITWINAVSLPPWAKKRIICLLESERPLDPRYIPLYNGVACVIPMNSCLKKLAEKAGIANLTDPIANGINTEEFCPAPRFPNEFVVGAAGNFSLDFYDEWKGFSKYIIPACKLANVKLKWCSWLGSCWSMPGVRGEQIKMEKMGDWYRNLSCLVSMSKSEGCSGVIFEAMATGLPVISTKVGWHGENCKDELAWIDRPIESEETQSKISATIYKLAEKIKYLRNQPRFCKEIGNKARKFAEKWPHERIADQLRPIINKTLNDLKKA